MTNIRVSHLLNFLQQQVKQKGIRSIGIHNLVKAQELLNDRITNCCLTHRVAKRNPFLDLFVRLLNDMNTAFHTAQLLQVKRVLDNILSCCGVVSNFSFVVNPFEDDPTEANFTIISSVSVPLTVDWGDGTTTDYAASTNRQALHTYATSGVFTITLIIDPTVVETVDLTFSLVTTVQNITVLTALERLDIDGGALVEFMPIVVNGIPLTLRDIRINNNIFTSAEVNAVLIYIDTLFTDNLGGTLLLQSTAGTNPPTGAGATAKTSLIAKNWIVGTDL